MNQVASDKMRWINFICSVFIAVLHLSVSFSDSNLRYVSFYQQLAVPAMSYFFFSSAYFYFRKYDTGVYWKNIKKRIPSLLIPYVIWNMIEFVICGLRGYITVSAAQLCKGMIFVYIPVIDLSHEPLIGALWFVIRLLTFEITVPVIFYIIKNKKIFMLAMCVLLGFIYVFDINYYAYLYWLPIYMAGAFLGYHYKEQFENFIGRSEVKSNLAIKFLFTAAAGCVYAIFVWICWENALSYTLERWLAIPVILVCIYLVEWYPKPKWVVVHGSFFLYCAHIPARFLIAGGLFRFEKIFGWNYPNFYFVIMISGILFIEWILYKTAPKLLAILNGSR